MTMRLQPPRAASQPTVADTSGLASSGGHAPCPPDDHPADLAELAQLERIVAGAGGRLASQALCHVQTEGRRFPVIAVTVGNPAPDLPGVAFVGGVHGLERIGAEVVLAYLRGLAERLAWDQSLNRQLESLRLVFVPVLNPGGLWRGTRANPNGVDLMRNSPVEARDRVPFLIGGQRISAGLPWYRGPRAGAMEDEAMALCQLIEDELLHRPFSLVLDCHSGFGLRDRIWFPYAHSPLPIDHLAEMHALATIFERSHFHHNYLIEPQSRHYLAHGDLWDHLYRRAIDLGAGPFLPLTLEMGSWVWVKKNPRQLFDRRGIFNPLVEHRQQRVLRRHLPWFDFLTRAAESHARWRPDAEARQHHRESALDRWYRTTP